MTSCINSAIGFRDAPPVSPECVSTVAVSSVRMKPSSPRNPAELAGRFRETQTVSETTTESVFRLGAAFEMIFSKFGEPISSSNSQRKRMLTGTSASIAARAPKSALSAGPLSSVVPRP